MLRLKVSLLNKHLTRADAIELHDKHTPHAPNEKDSMKQALKIEGKIQVKIFCRHKFKGKFGLETQFSRKKITFLSVFGKILSVTLATENCMEQSFFAIKRKSAFR